jgi:CYTH domain-containing protein/thymidylate kinase
MQNPIKKIVYTGGPCGGKTTFLALAEQMLGEYGIKVVVMPEVATSLILSGLNPDPKQWKYSTAFQKHLLQFSVLHERALLTAMEDLQTDGPKVLICDRGLLDGMAYVGRSAFLEITESLGLGLEQMRSSYDAVIHFVTAADGAEEYYTLENNAARSETPEEARALDKKTQQAWLDHPHLHIIGNETDFEGKMYRAKCALARTLAMPEPQEIERKFLVKGFNRSRLPDDAVMVEITQHYLDSDDVVRERRVRARTVDGVSTYYHTVKAPTDDPRVRIEKEERISLAEYEGFMEKASVNAVPVQKLRFCFSYLNQRFELDVYQGRHQGLVILEIELQDKDTEVRLPEWLSCTEVTGDEMYKNFSLAHGEYT